MAENGDNRAAVPDDDIGRHDDDVDEVDDDSGDWFDRAVGCIEDIVIDDDFQNLQISLLEKHYHHFEPNNDEGGESDPGENKLIYMDIFKEYTEAVETFIEAELEKRMPAVAMKDFLQELENRKANLEGEVFEMLFTLTDFMAFKDMFVGYGVVKQSVGDIGAEALTVSGL